MKKALLIVATALTSSLLSANILITEILYNPAGTDVPSATFTQEWVEIYNAGDTAVDLTSWKLRDEDANSSNWGFLSGTLQPGQAGVITQSTQAEFEASWPTAVGALVIQVPGWGTIANTAGAGNEALTILDDMDNVIDVADYWTSAPWPASLNGASVYLLPGFMDPVANDDGANWGAADIGVHGAMMSLVAGEFTGGSIGSPGTVVVPEPSTFALLAGLGILGLVTIRRRR